MKKRDGRSTEDWSSAPPSRLNSGKFSLPEQSSPAAKQTNPFGQPDPFARVNNPGARKAGSFEMPKTSDVSQTKPEARGQQLSKSSSAVKASNLAPNQSAQTEIASGAGVLPESGNLLEAPFMAAITLLVGIGWVAYQGGKYYVVETADFTAEYPGVSAALQALPPPLNISGTLSAAIVQDWLDRAYDAGVLTIESEPTREERLEDLANDPSRGGVDATTHREAEAGLGSEEAGLIPGPIRRPRQGESTADFVDANGQYWDEKSYQSRERVRERMTERDRQQGVERDIPEDVPLPGEFDVETAIEKISEEVRNGENVIANTRDLNSQDEATLREAVRDAGLESNVVFYP